MKIVPSSSRHRKQNGSATLIVLILLGAMLAFIAGNTANLNQLKRELDLIEQKQLKRQVAVPVVNPLPHSRKP